jgi:hypothetical protein
VKNFNTSDAAANPADEKTATVSIEDSWIYGWTHYGKTGQTKARINKLTRKVEIKESSKWIKCHPGCEEFFTSPGFSINTASFFVDAARNDF